VNRSLAQQRTAAQCSDKLLPRNVQLCFLASQYLSTHARLTDGSLSKQYPFDQSGMPASMQHSRPGCGVASVGMITHLAQGRDDDEHVPLHDVEVPPRRRPPLPHQALHWHTFRQIRRVVPLQGGLGAAMPQPTSPASASALRSQGFRVYWAASVRQDEAPGCC
jgi:hypothetical protein